MVSTLYSVVAPYEQKSEVSTVWEKYTVGKSIKLSSRVNSIAICPKEPYKYGLPNGHKVNLYKCDGDKLYRKISGFGSRVSCCEFRRDGNLLLVGEEKGVIRMCTTDKNKYHLRKIDAHKGSVTAVSFFQNGLLAASLGADAVARVWDVALATQVTSFVLRSGKEVARAMVTGYTDSNLMCCGNFEGCVTIYDIRQPKPTQTFVVPMAVSSLALNCTDDSLVIASGSSLHFWDMTANKFMEPASNPDHLVGQNGLRLHYKLITSLSIVKHPVQNEEVLLSVSMDKMAKFTCLRDMKELYQIQCPIPLTSVGATPSCETIVFGGENGFVKVQHYPIVESSSKSKSHLTNDDDPLEQMMQSFSQRWKPDPNIAKSSDEWFNEPITGSRRAPKDWLKWGEKLATAIKQVPLIHESTEISRRGSQFYANAMTVPLKRVDILLRRFSHSRALSVALSLQSGRKSRNSVKRKYNTNLAIGVIRELIRRDLLAPAVAGRAPQQLRRLLRFVLRNVWRREAATTCLELYNCILDIYLGEELVGLPEFAKLNLLLNQLSSNTHSLSQLSERIRYHMSEIYRTEENQTNQSELAIESETQSPEKVSEAEASQIHSPKPKRMRTS